MTVDKLLPAIRFEQLDCCPVCASPQRSPKFILPDYFHGVAGEFQYVSCGSCATVYQNPRVALEDLGQCYPSNYFTHFPAGVAALDPPDMGKWSYNLRRAIRCFADGGSRAGLSRTQRIIGRLLAPVPPARRWARYGVRDPLATSSNGERCLEVGPGAGNTLRRLRWIGWEAVGLDFDPAAAAIAQSASGCEVKVGTVTSASLPEAGFQLIYMCHVLEHLPDLRSTLERCFRLLAAGGRLVIVYPNPESLGTKQQQEFAVNWEPPRHLVIPPIKAIVPLLTEIGFSDIESRTSAASAAGYRKIGRQFRAGRTGKGFENTKPSLGDHLFALYETLLVFFGLPVGEEIRVVARRPN